MKSRHGVTMIEMLIMYVATILLVVVVLTQASKLTIRSIDNKRYIYLPWQEAPEGWYRLSERVKITNKEAVEIIDHTNNN